MTGLLLATLLNLSPGVVLADNVSDRHVFLSDVRFRTQFVADESEEGPRPSLDTMTREQLAAELRRLDEQKPSIAGPIVLLSIGAGLSIPGTYLLITGLGNLAFTSSSSINYIAGIIVAGFGGILLTAGVILIIIGAITLPLKLSKRSTHAEEVASVRQKLNSLDQGNPPPPPPPGPEDVPPPPPPPPPLPPQANFVVPGGMQTVMTF